MPRVTRTYDKIAHHSCRLLQDVHRCLAEENSFPFCSIATVDNAVQTIRKFFHDTAQGLIRCETPPSRKSDSRFFSFRTNGCNSIAVQLEQIIGKRRYYYFSSGSFEAIPTISHHVRVRRRNRMLYILDTVDKKRYSEFSRDGTTFLKQFGIPTPHYLMRIGHKYYIGFISLVGDLILRCVKSSFL